MQALTRLIYGPTPTELVKTWQQQLKRETRTLDREIIALQRSTLKVKAELKRLALKGDLKNAKILAREVVRSLKQGGRLELSKARINSMNMQLSHQLATLKITGTLQKSTEIMKLSNDLVKLPELSSTMRALSIAMTRAGIMDEMIEEGLEGMEEEDMEEEAEIEVDKILWEVTEGKLGVAGSTKVGTLPKGKVEPTAEEKEADEEMERAIAGLLNA